MRILISAYSCAPHKGSEAEVGWGWAQAHAAAGHEVVVVTRAGNLPAIARAEKCGDASARPRFIGFDGGSWGPMMKRWGGEIGGRLYYAWWQVALRRALERGAFGLAEAVGEADVVQHVTVAKSWAASALRQAAPPFVWGPVGGGDDVPLRFWLGLGFRGALEEAGRSLMRAIAERLPAVRQTARSCRLALAATPATARRLKRLGAREVAVLSQAALGPADLERLAAERRDASGPLRLLVVGELVRRKGVHLVLGALAQVGEGTDWRLDVLGEGRERAWLQRRATHLGLAGRVSFHGQLSRPLALAALREAHVLIQASLRDSAGMACVEGMAAGVVVVCLDQGGPGFLVPSHAGIKVPAMRPRDVERDLASAIRRLHDDREELGRLSGAAAQYARDELSWPARQRRFMTALDRAGLCDDRVSPRPPSQVS